MEVLKDEKIINRILNKGVEQILPSKEGMEELLKSGRRLNIYQGFDPTAETLHIGHTVGMRKLEDFRKLGHNVIFLIGDFTARIGDPTDKTAARKKLSKEEVESNMKTYVEQASHILDINNKENPVTVLFNSQWLEPLDFSGIIELASNFTVQQMLKRSMFQERLNEDKPIYLHEFLYPLMQGYDSVMMDIDIEVGGNDQLFNMLAGRDLISNMLNKDKYVLAGKLLTTSDGKKMGKSEGNMIKLSDSANDIYGKVMAMPDEQLIRAFEILTTYELEKIEEISKRLEEGENPLNIKKELALQVTKEIKTEDEALKAQKYFEDVYQNKETSEEIPNVNIDKKEIDILELLISSNISSSKTEARRLIEQGAVKLNDTKVSDWKEIIHLNPTQPTLLRVGRKLCTISLTN